MCDTNETERESKKPRNKEPVLEAQDKPTAELHPVSSTTHILATMGPTVAATSHFGRIVFATASRSSQCVNEMARED
ncbi:Hypothetical protein SMAX5B_018273 [Scophthalmus maximus]|uniref:Uncharacterized protein n=1 Tax=Scophthalmus maximus TaxID=52904 RepID=A0A2U9C9P8_SCOMX|nr:Hypothetical protein SMAX5B_018273 [Scophthalmus maximus]